MTKGDAPQRRYDVAIVGGGVIGICTGLSLIERGLRVALIDRDEPGQGASYGNAGVISPWSIVPQAMPGVWRKLPGMLLRPTGPASVAPRRMLSYLPWLLQFLKAGQPDNVRRISDAMHLLCGDGPVIYRHHLAGTGHEHLVQDSNYVHASRNASSVSLKSLGNELRMIKGAELERIDAKALRALEPALSDEFQAAIVIKGQARALSPGGIGAALARKFSDLGGQIYRRSVSALEQAEMGWRVLSSDGDVEADKVVVTAGAWSVSLLKTIGFSAPLAAERGYHVMAANPSVSFANSVLDMDNYVVASSMEQGVRVSGMAEFAGPDDPPNQKRFKIMRRLTKQMAPDINLDDAVDWMGVRPSFPDSLPLIDAIPGKPGLSAAFGHSHYGFMMAPKTGQIAADVITGTRSNHDLSAFSATRF